MARPPDSMPAFRALEADDPRLCVAEIVQGHLVRRDRRIPLRRPRVETLDPDAALAVEHADHPVRALVQLSPDRPTAVQLRQARVRHEADALPLRHRAAGRAYGPLEQLGGLPPPPVLVGGHLREARQDREARAGLLNLFIKHAQY